jgi:hypothetical protein
MSDTATVIPFPCRLSDEQHERMFRLSPLMEAICAGGWGSGWGNGAPDTAAPSVMLKPRPVGGWRTRDAEEVAFQ